MKLALCFLFALAAAAQTPQLKPRTGASPEAEALQRKLDTIKRNAHPQHTPVTTALPESEINAWFASSYAQLPQGVRTLHLVGQNGQVTANAKVDFDEITAGRAGSNPLLAMFRGIHDVEVVATGRADDGQATVRVQSVALDGVVIPPMVLEFFVERFITPQHPSVGIDSHFTPGYHVDSARIGEHVLTVVQK